MLSLLRLAVLTLATNREDAFETRFLCRADGVSLGNSDSATAGLTW